ncbi:MULTISPECIES: response regulator transcription factor [Pseudoalteromonas]|uniref:Response regulator n=1 Tax=Pseudoalteromonas rubra TaxID=43658 RepID=A0A5S3UTB7_9GAMM|nr:MULTISPECIES: response regulator transcription factor [Pseudoalteromonas]MCG7561305.1 response regulator transcription factor [Pseudoalteromonas sp. McH1-42]MEC4090715.1 response regulator transcription factor [Pseudoalteromonas rubra]QPB85640.1 response regulator [Pseudoalteromonas rubra]
MNRIKVHLVDDQALVRQGMQALLALCENIECNSSSANGLEFMNQYNAGLIDADVILLDMRMPELDGVGVLEQLNAISESPKVLILTTFDDTTKLQQALQLGANGCMLKDVELEELEAAIKAVYEGKLVIQRALSNVFKQAESALDELTDREKQILVLIARGLSNKEIASQLFKAEGTIRNHVSNLLSKLQVRDRTQATLKAVELGLVNQNS